MKVKILIVSILTLLFLPSSVFAIGATLSLSPATGTFNKSCTYPVEVKIDTGGAQTDGTDAILFFDQTRFSATITNGTVYPDYPGNSVDATNGKITVSGLSSVATPFTGSGTLATINLTVLAAAPEGATQVKFDFDPNNKGNTRDSNVVERSTIADVLNSVTDGNYIIGTGTCGSISNDGNSKRGGPIATPSALIPLKPPPPTLPPAGTEGLTFALAIFGGVLTVLGILGLALL